jgi:hypothetical protein
MASKVNEMTDEWMVEYHVAIDGIVSSVVARITAGVEPQDTRGWAVAWFAQPVGCVTNNVTL